MPSHTGSCRVFPIHATARLVECDDIGDSESTMKFRKYIASTLLIIATLGATAAAATSQTSAAMHAKGSFDIKITPQQADNSAAKAAQVGRLSLDKHFHGELEATSQGEMLASGDGSQSGAYVAIEKVTGTLQGRNGSFVLMHSAVMNHGKPESWSVVVVPDSGTEQFTGLAGTMTIIITADGKHHYDFAYTLPQN
jgi:hypothetical protein